MLTCLQIRIERCRIYLTSACQYGTFHNVLKFVTVYGLGHSWPTATNGYDASTSMLQYFDQQ